jgi:outer membrane protein TolC
MFIHLLNCQRVTAPVILLVCLNGCVSYDLNQGMQRAAQDTVAFNTESMSLAVTAEQRQQRAGLTQQLLSAPVGQKQAVDLMLVNSAAFQSLLAQHWAQAAATAQSGRISNPSVALERIVTGSETEFNGLLTFGLLDVLTLPQRADIARLKLAQAQIKLSADVVDQVTQVRQAWVRAVAARAALHYAHKVADAALASDELAARMLAAGNFNALTRSKHRLFHVQAQMQLAAAQQSKLSRTEELVRLLGLDATQALQLQLPDKLPELPVTAISTESAAQQAVQQRLDIRMAKAELETAARAQGLTGITSLLDVQLTVIGGTVNSGGTDTKRSGAQISVKLPLFDGGDMQQSQMHAQTLAAANRLRAAATDAASSLRETHAAYSTAFAIARQFQDEVLPLRQRMADENLLRYNAMQIGVFDLLTDATEQNAAVSAAIDAQQQFWLSEAALQSTLIGRPLSVSLSVTNSKGSGNAAAH